MNDLLPFAALLVLLIVGELIFRRLPGAGGLLYNFSGTVAGLFWILGGAFLVWGGAYLLGGLLVVIGVNIHRSNYRTVKSTVASDGRSRLNG